MRRGDIEASATDPTGLFSFDTRFLSNWVLTVNGERLTALSTDDLQYFETRFFLIPGASAVYQNSKQSVIRTRAVADGFHEEITVLNHDDKPVDLTIRIEAASDFADLFEVKDALEKKGKYGAQGRARAAGARVPAGDVREGDRDHATGPGRSSTGRADVQAPGSSRRASGRPMCEVTVSLLGGRRRRATAREARPRVRARPLAPRRASSRVRLGAAREHLPAQPRRPRRAALLPDDGRRAAAFPPPACRGS